MYVFDTSALINAYKNDFPPAATDDFWKWLDDVGKTDGIIIPETVFEELNKKTDGLAKFLTTYPNLKKEPTTSCLPSLKQVLDAYGSLSDVDLEMLQHKADPYVIAHAIAMGGTVVSSEVSQPLRVGINKKIPDICDSLVVQFCSYPRFIWLARGKYP